jgi:hypothetical protein
MFKLCSNRVQASIQIYVTSRETFNCMASTELPMANKPVVTDSGGSKRISIPANIVAGLDIEAGEEPDRIEYDEDNREVTFRF